MDEEDGGLRSGRAGAAKRRCRLGPPPHPTYQLKVNSKPKLYTYALSHATIFINCGLLRSVNKEERQFSLKSALAVACSHYPQPLQHSPRPSHATTPRPAHI
jgi:hypothetical protein